MWKTYCDQIQSDMSKVAHTGDKRSEETGHIGKSRKGFYYGKKKKLYPFHKGKTQGGIM